MIEANPRASRTVPFVSKAIGVPLAKIACRLMLGERLADMDARHSRAQPAPRVGQGGGAAVRPLPARRRAARPRDEVDRRGDGRGGRLPGRVRQGPGRRGRRAARRPARCSSRVTDGDKPAATQLAARLPRHGLPACWPPAARRRRSGAWACRSSGSAKLSRGLAERGRADRGRRGRPGDQHAHRLGRPRRRLRDPPRRGRARHPLHHHAVAAPARPSARSAPAAAATPTVDLAAGAARRIERPRRAGGRSRRRSTEPRTLAPPERRAGARDGSRAARRLPR